MRKRSSEPEDWTPREREERKLVANIGDNSPLDHGGHLIYKVTHPQNTTYYTSVYFDAPLEAEYDEDWENKDKYQVYRWDVEADVLKDQDWVLDSLNDLAGFVGATPEDLEEASTDPDVRVRARLYEDIGRNFGFENLDSYSDTFDRKQMMEIFPELAKRGLGIES